MKKEDWIDVKDLLPGSNTGDILCYFSDKKSRTYNSQRIKITGVFGFEDGKGGHFEAHITHWTVVVPPGEE